MSARLIVRPSLPDAPCPTAFYHATLRPASFFFAILRLTTSHANPLFRQPQLVVLPVPAKIKDCHQTPSPAVPADGIDAFLLLVAIQPLKSRLRHLLGIQFRAAYIQVVEFLYIMMECVVNRETQHFPVLLAALVPFPQLGEFISHKV